MDLVKKITVHNPSVHRIRSLSEKEKMAIAAVFIHMDRRIKEEVRELAIDIVVQARHSEAWLACDCCPEQAWPPMLTIVRHEGGNLLLRKVSRYGEHAPDCEFFRESRPLQVITEPKAINLLNATTFFAEQQRIKTDPAPTEANTASVIYATAGERLPRLGKKLYTLLEKAGWNVMTTPAIPPLGQYFQQLYKAAREYHIAPHCNLADYLWTLPWQITKASQFLRAQRTQWPKSYAVQGFFLLLVDKIENNALQFTGKQKDFVMEVKGKVRLSSGRLGTISAPYLALVSFAETITGNNWFEPLKGFAIPVYSRRCLIPIESHYERLVLEKLLYLQEILWSKHHLPVAIRKPLESVSVLLPDTETPTFCRPDFLLQAGDKTVVLEVMGSHEEAYLTQKTHTHPSMAQLGHLLTFDACAAERDRAWSARLDTLAKQIYAALLR